MIDIYCFISALGSARALVRIHLSPLLSFLQEVRVLSRTKISFKRGKFYIALNMPLKIISGIR